MLKPLIYLASIAALALTACQNKKQEADAAGTEPAEASQASQTSETSQAQAVKSIVPVTLVRADQPVSFNEHIQPILSANCYHCHGPDSGSRQPQKNPLRLDKEEEAFAARENGKPVIIKGNPDESYLVTVIESKDKELVMPPHPDKNPHGKIMSSEDIALIRRWVKEGAAFEDHWAYIAPQKAELPVIKNPDWARNPIDYFVAKKQDDVGLAPNESEAKPRLLRRLYFDLTGLPPSLEEIDRILSDERDWDTVYLDTVNQLLKTDAYAEHWARHWLDVARYADTHGIHFDNYRSIWPYRDWVINAFKTNMPFDQFTREQIAGDMMPKATTQQIVATGFNRCLPTTGEGGAIADEYDAIYAQDRVDSTSAAWLGLTTGCAACHDHKFDAISTKENYQLTAFFRNTPMTALDRNNEGHPPNITFNNAEDTQRLEKINQQLTGLHQQSQAHRKAHEQGFNAWLNQQKTTPAPPQSLPAGLVFHMPLDSEAGGITDNTGKAYLSDKPVNWVPGKAGQAIQLTKNNSVNLGNVGNFERDQKFSFGTWLKAPHGGMGGIIAKMNAPKKHRGYDLWLENKNLAVHLIHDWPSNQIKVITKKPFPHDKWFHVMVTYDGSSKAKGIKMYIDGKSVALQSIGGKLTESIKTVVPLRLGKRDGNQPIRNGALQNFQIYERALGPAEVAKLAIGLSIEQIARLPLPSKAQTQQLRDHYFSKVNPHTVKLAKQINALNQEKKSINNRASLTLVMKENADKKPFAHILIRGQYADKGEKVTPDTPAALPSMGELPRNRFGLAQWLTLKENPLPARITVNRYWYYLFGRGIVTSTGDFGVMGARPTHPKLLDWLAVDFVENGWDFHHLLRTMVTSSTYRQSAQITPEKLERDPLNKLIARGPRYRLDAEQIRDLALNASGLMHQQVGGPSVKPYQPMNIWKSVAMPQSNTKNYQRDTGNKLYRRSLYTFWKRTAPHPSMEILNAPVREVSCVQRELTNTPLQAFVIMNDPQFVESSRKLAERTLKAAKTQDERANYIARQLLSRSMSSAELEIVKTTQEQALEKFSATPAEASKLITVGESKPDPSLPAAELASWTLVANQVLNMDETLNK